MKFGFILNTQFLVRDDPVVKVRELVEQVRVARDAGFDSFCVSHHYLLTLFQMVQPLATLGRLAAEAGSMRLVTNIFLLTIHDPVYVAEESLSVPYEELLRDRFIVGTPDECREEIECYHRVIGVNHFLLRLQWPGMPQELVLDQIGLLGQHVIPQLKDK